MKQHLFQNNELKLIVRKSPLPIRASLFLIAFICFTFPTLGMISSVVLGFGLQFGFFIGIGLFALLGFFVLRIALWNTYGQEILQFYDSEIKYEANYRWFKDGQKTINIENINYFSLKAGYEEDNDAVLVLDNGIHQIECVTKMPQQQIEELVLFLNKAK